MGKFVLATVAIAIAMVTQAASVSWRINTPGTGADYKDYKVYICESVTAFESEAQIADYLLGEGENVASIKNNRGDGSASGKITGIADSKSGQMLDFYVVIVSTDGSGYWKTTGTAQVYTTQTEHTDYNLADAGTMLATPATAFGTSPVPEPTSGLMIFLGFCLMTLKRKRA